MQRDFTWSLYTILAFLISVASSTRLAHSHRISDIVFTHPSFSPLLPKKTRNFLIGSMLYMTNVVPQGFCSSAIDKFIRDSTGKALSDRKQTMNHFKNVAVLLLLYINIDLRRCNRENLYQSRRSSGFKFKPGLRDLYHLPLSIISA